jgi:hypothetical protein
MQEEDPDIIGLPEPIETVKYIIYCHGRTRIHERFPLPQFREKIVSYSYVADVGHILLGGETNILTICGGDDDPREIKRSGQEANEMELMGGPPIDRELGLYCCFMREDRSIIANLIFNMSAGQYAPPFLCTLSDMIEQIFVYHQANHENNRIKITMHTCRGYEHIAFVPEHMKIFTVDDLADALGSKMTMKNAMDTSGGKKKRRHLTKKQKKRKFIYS